MDSLSDTIKNNIVVVLSAAVVSAFGLGWAAYGATLRAGDTVPVNKTQLDELRRLAAANRECKPDLPSAQICRTVIGDFLLKADVERDYVLRAQVPVLPQSRAKFVPGKWRYISMPGASGDQVADRLSEIGPAEDAVVVAYDASAKNTFHIWYTGGGTGTKFRYEYAQPRVLSADPSFNYFRSEEGIVPAGIGGVGSDAVPIYFRVTR